MTQLKPDEGGGELINTVGPHMNRRNFMKAGSATVLGAAMLSGAPGYVHEDLDPVGDAEAALPLLAIPLAYPLVTVLAGLAGVAILYDWFTDDVDLTELRNELIELDDESAAVLIAELSRALDARETQVVVERESRFNFNVELDGSGSVIDEFGDSDTISMLDVAWSEVRAAAGAEFSIGGDGESAGEYATERARGVEMSSAVTLLENGNANFEALAYAFADQASREAVEVLYLGDGDTVPSVASGRPAGTTVVASDYDGNDPVVVAAPLQVAEDYPDPAGFSDVADDYEPVVLCVFDGTEWIPAVNIDGLPFEFHDDVSTLNIRAETVTVFGEHDDALEGTKHPHAGVSFEAAVQQLADAAEQLIDNDIDEFVNAAEEQIEEGDLEPEDLIGARELVGRFSDTENFSRFAAELVGAGFRMPGDGSLGTQATIRHHDLSQLEAGLQGEFSLDLGGAEPGAPLVNYGDEKVYVGSQDGGELWVFDFDGEELDHITIDGATDSAGGLSASSDYRYIVSVSERAENESYVFDTEGSEGWVVEQEVSNAVIHDGTVYAVDGDSDSRDLLKWDVTDDNPTVETVDDVHAWEVVTSDGDYIIGGRSDVVILDPDEDDEEVVVIDVDDLGTEVRAIDATTDWIVAGSREVGDNVAIIDRSDDNDVTTISVAGSMNNDRIRGIGIDSQADIVYVNSEDDDDVAVIDLTDASVIESKSWPTAPMQRAAIERQFDLYEGGGGDFELAYVIDDAGEYRFKRRVATHSVHGTSEATGHVFIDTSDDAVSISEGGIVSETQFDVSYLVTVEDGATEHTAVLMHSDEGPIEIVEVHLDEATEDAKERAEDAVSDEIDEEEGEGLNSEETPDDDDDEDTDVTGVTEDHYIVVPGDSEDIAVLAERGDVIVRVVNLSTGEVEEEKAASNITEITVEGEDKWVLPVEQAYSDVMLTYDAGFTLTQPVEGEQDPTDPDDIAEQIEKIAQAIIEIEEARQQAVTDAESAGDGPGILTMVAGVGVVGTILWLLFGD